MNEEYRDDIAAFCWKLGKLLALGIPVLQALEVAAQLSRNVELQRAAHALRDGVRDGERFSDILQQFPDFFDTVSVELARAGEITGTLDIVMTAIAEHTLTEPIDQWMAERRKTS